MEIMIPKFFASWWQGLVFGIVTTVAMLIVAWALAVGWKKYEESGAEPPEPSCDPHH